MREIKKKSFLRRFKVPLLMNLLTFLLTLCSLSLSAAINAQNTKVSLNLQKVSLEKVLTEIQEQTELQFLYRTKDVENVEDISIQSKNKKVFDVLEECLEHTKLEYKVLGESVIIQTKSTAKTSPQLQDQNRNTIKISGTVYDEEGVTVPNASVFIKSNALLGTVTDIDGKFTMNGVPKNAVLAVSFIGYKKTEIALKHLSKDQLQNLEIKLVQSQSDLDEIVVVAHGSQRKESIVGAITTLEPEDLKTPTRSLSTQLAGKVAGVTFVQRSGQPGKDGASFIIRGINSVTGNATPLILIDGLARTIDDVDPNDIASFSVLKDASATAVYGLEGANGIIVITTKSGKASQKPTVRFSYSSSINNSTFKPKWIDAVEYAKIKNEAFQVRGKKAFYTEEEIAKFGDDNQDFYPNVDWYKAMFKPNNLAHKANFNIGGGGNVVTYYMSGGFYTEDGMFRSDISSYDSNAKYSQFNFRSNLKADLSPTTTLGLGFDGRYNTTTDPGQGAGGILKLINETNPTLFPTQYSNGEAPIEPENAQNPYSLLNKTGFVRAYSNIMSTNLSLNQKLNFIAEGLFFRGVASFSKVNNYSHKYVKDYQRHRIDLENSYMRSGYDEDGNLLTVNTTPDVDDKMTFKKSTPSGHRNVELQASLNYAQSFGEDYSVTGLILYKQSEYMADSPGGKGNELLINALPSRKQSIAGRLTFDYKHKYFADVNFGASGSQLFTPSKRWSSFPSVGAGWLVSEEPFWAGMKNTVDFLKLRASYGVVGAPGNAARFGYMASTSGKKGYTFGFGKTAYSSENIKGQGEDRLEQLGLTWERINKLDLGLEIGLFEDFKMIIDAYRNVRNDQLVELKRLPATLGLPSKPRANLAKNISQGFDIDVTYSKSFGDFKINYIKGILGYSENEIKENGELDPKVPYQSAIGLDWGRGLNYIALGYFKDQADIDNSPIQTWSEVMPGDLKYKDVNGDGVISAQDKVWLGNQYPKWTYSLALDLSYKNWTIATRVIGKADMFRTISGSRIPFNAKGQKGAIFRAAYNDHWTPESFSGTKATENPNAKYPRLAFGTDNANNTQPSTWWLREASYLRIADVELGYNWIVKSPNLPFKNIYFYGRGDNLATFSKFKDWNPELTSSYAYPLKRTFTFGLEIKFKL
ncbi:SusC/RagA family TonB-linked outer membrane protein [Puteibacter caeruleilacunae]|nr:SusC/RagA family TonB-linked outer membrane protein [Puteibacter caeruleilacunae]